MTNAETTTSTQTAAVAEQGTQVKPEKAASTKVASRKKGAPKANKGAKEAASRKAAKPKSAPKKQVKEKSPTSKSAAIPREFSKKAVVLDLLRRPKGATLAEIAKATDWKSHSIRGFISGTLTKKMGLTVASTKNDAGDRTYRIAK